MNTVNHSPFYTYAKDKTLIHGMYWLPKTNIKAIICLVHGLGGHIARFSQLAEDFCNCNIGLIGVDLRGHGKSFGKRGCVCSLNDYYNDISATLKYLKNNISDADIPVYLYGNSMGGPVSLKYAIKNKFLFSGVILTAPWFCLRKQPKGFSLFILKNINRIFPNVTISSGIKSKDFRSNPQMQAEAIKDSLVHKRISIRLLFLIYHLGLELILKEIEGFNLPTLIFHGESDMVTDINASKRYTENNYKNVEFISLPDTKHEIHVEAERKNVLKKIVSWIESIEQSKTKENHHKGIACINK